MAKSKMNFNTPNIKGLFVQIGEIVLALGLGKDGIETIDRFKIDDIDNLKERGYRDVNNYSKKIEELTRRSRSVDGFQGSGIDYLKKKLNFVAISSNPQKTFDDLKDSGHESAVSSMLKRLDLDQEEKPERPETKSPRNSDISKIFIDTGDEIAGFYISKKNDLVEVKELKKPIDQLKKEGWQNFEDFRSQLDKTKFAKADRTKNLLLSIYKNPTPDFTQQWNKVGSDAINVFTSEPPSPPQPQTPSPPQTPQPPPPPLPQPKSPDPEQELDDEYDTEAEPEPEPEAEPELDDEYDTELDDEYDTELDDEYDTEAEPESDDGSSTTSKYTDEEIEKAKIYRAARASIYKDPWWLVSFIREEDKYETPQELLDYIDDVLGKEEPEPKPQESSFWQNVKDRISSILGSDDETLTETEEETAPEAEAETEPETEEEIEAELEDEEEIEAEPEEEAVPEVEDEEEPEESIPEEFDDNSPFWQKVKNRMNEFLGISSDDDLEELDDDYVGLPDPEEEAEPEAEPEEDDETEPEPELGDGDDSSFWQKVHSKMESILGIKFGIKEFDNIDNELEEEEELETEPEEDDAISINDIWWEEEEEAEDPSYWQRVKNKISSILARDVDDDYFDDEEDEFTESSNNLNFSEEEEDDKEFQKLLNFLNQDITPNTSEEEGAREILDYLYDTAPEEPEEEEEDEEFQKLLNFLNQEITPDTTEDDKEFQKLLNFLNQEVTPDTSEEEEVMEPSKEDQEYLVSEEDDQEEDQKLLDFLNDIGPEVEESEGTKQILDFLGIVEKQEEEANTKLYKSSPQTTGYKPDTSNPPKINNEIQSGLYNVWASGEDARSFEEQKRGLELLKRTTSSIGRLHGSKIERMKESGLNEEEAQGLSIWISLKYPLINAALRGASGDKEDLEIGTAAAISSAKALRKLPGFTFEEMRKNAPEGYTDEDFREDGTLIRGVSIDSENIDSFLEIYKSSLENGQSFHEPYMFAATGRKEHSIVEDSNIRYIVNPISDGSGQGKAIDQFKNENYEDEVLYPPYSKFKVKEIKDYRNIPTSIRDVELFPYWDSGTSKKIPPFILQTLKKIDRSGKIKREEIDVLTEFMNFCYDRKISGQSPEEYLKEADPELVKKYSGYDVLSLGLSDIGQLDTFLSSVHEINRQSRQDGDVVIYLDEV